MTPQLDLTATSFLPSYSYIRKHHSSRLALVENKWYTSQLSRSVKIYYLIIWYTIFVQPQGFWVPSTCEWYLKSIYVQILENYEYSLFLKVIFCRHKTEYRELFCSIFVLPLTDENLFYATSNEGWWKPVELSEFLSKFCKTSMVSEVVDVLNCFTPYP